MNLKKWGLLFITICLFFLISINIVFYFKINPSNKKSIISLAVLGQNLEAQKYFPNDNDTLNLGVNLRWFIYLQNDMDEIQYFLIKVKIINSDIPSPNISYCYPCPAPSIYEIRRILLNNETLIEPFVWSINNAIKNNETITILKININGHLIDTEIVKRIDEEFKIIFEIWVYDGSLNEFVFNLSDISLSRCLWNQFFFDLNVS